MTATAGFLVVANAAAGTADRERVDAAAAALAGAGPTDVVFTAVSYTHLTLPTTERV